MELLEKLEELIKLTEEKIRDEKDEEMQKVFMKVHMRLTESKRLILNAGTAGD